MRRVLILGGGPAGAAAGVAAAGEGAVCEIVEKSKFPRHKVCGEFFSPEIEGELRGLGVWDAFVGAGAARVRRMRLCFGKREKAGRLEESGWGLSRYAFDALMFARAREVVRGGEGEDARVIACGRTAEREPRGRRLFGFKAHFEGPADDAVELFFFDGCYVGIAPVENGRTNVCGLGPENFLRRFGFEFDAVIASSAALLARTRALRRSMEWVATGPLQYGQRFSETSGYLAGDALSFVDPFTGSGLLAAVKTGRSAGMAAARGESVEVHLARSRAALRRPFEVSSVLRGAIERGLAEWLIGLVPTRVLFALTRPK